MRRGDPCAQCPAPTLLPEVQRSVAAYLLCVTQWRYVAGMGAARIGLDYAGCMAAIDAHADALLDAQTTRATLMRDLQIIERAVLDCDAERRREAADRPRAIET